MRDPEMLRCGTHHSAAVSSQTGPDSWKVSTLTRDTCAFGTAGCAGVLDMRVAIKSHFTA
jgi:hypothetical protein